MASDFDKLMEEMQASIIEDARKTHSEKVIQRWLNPRQLGEIKDPQGYGKVTDSHGDTMQIFLKIDEDKIIDARFLTDGGMNALAAGCMACELSIGKTSEEAFKISQERIITQLGGLPDESEHCAILASNTLQAALTDYMEFRNEHSWRRLPKK
jgi:nitrogen fixation NifU-like protein